MFPHSLFPFNTIPSVQTPFIVPPSSDFGILPPIYQPMVFLPPIYFQSMNPVMSSTLQPPPTLSNETTQKKEEPEIPPKLQPHQPKVQQKPVKKIQNPFRNIYTNTNLMNLILNFMTTSRKVEDLIFKTDPSFVEEKLDIFYRYVKDLRNHFSAYFNLSKVQKLFLGTGIPKYQPELHKIFRILAKFILEAKIPLCLLTSNRLQPELKSHHMKVRRIMLQCFVIKKEN